MSATLATSHTMLSPSALFQRWLLFQKPSHFATRLSSWLPLYSLLLLHTHADHFKTLNILCRYFRLLPTTLLIFGTQFAYFWKNSRILAKHSTKQLVFLHPPCFWVSLFSPYSASFSSFTLEFVVRIARSSASKKCWKNAATQLNFAASQHIPNLSTKYASVNNRLRMTLTCNFFISAFCTRFFCLYWYKIDFEHFVFLYEYKK